MCIIRKKNVSVIFKKFKDNETIKNSQFYDGKIRCEKSTEKSEKSSEKCSEKCSERGFVKNKKPKLRLCLHNTNSKRRLLKELVKIKKFSEKQILKNLGHLYIKMSREDKTESSKSPEPRENLISGSSVESNHDDTIEIIEISSGDDEVFQNTNVIAIPSEEDEEKEVKVLGFVRGNQKPRVITLSSDSEKTPNRQQISKHRAKTVDDDYENFSGELPKSNPWPWMLVRSWHPPQVIGTRLNPAPNMAEFGDPYFAIGENLKWVKVYPQKLECKNNAAKLYLINTANSANTSVVDTEVEVVDENPETEEETVSAGEHAENDDDEEEAIAQPQPILEANPDVSAQSFAAYVATQRLANMPFEFFKEFYQGFHERQSAQLEPQPAEQHHHYDQFIQQQLNQDPVVVNLEDSPDEEQPNQAENSESENAILEKTTFNLGADYVSDSFEYQETRTPRGEVGWGKTYLQEEKDYLYDSNNNMNIDQYDTDQNSDVSSAAQCREAADTIVDGVLTPEEQGVDDDSDEDYGLEDSVLSLEEFLNRISAPVGQSPTPRPRTHMNLRNVDIFGGQPIVYGNEFDSPSEDSREYPNLHDSDVTGPGVYVDNEPDPMPTPITGPGEYPNHFLPTPFVLRQPTNGTLDVLDSSGSDIIPPTPQTAAVVNPIRCDPWARHPYPMASQDVHVQTPTERRLVNGYSSSSDLPVDSLDSSDNPRFVQPGQEETNEIPETEVSITVYSASDSTTTESSSFNSTGSSNFDIQGTD